MQGAEKESRYLKRMDRYKGITLLAGSSTLFALSVAFLILDPRRLLRISLSTLLISVLWFIVGIILIRRGRNTASSKSTGDDE